MTQEAAIKYIKRLFVLIAGLFLYALGIVVTLKANIGYAPWDVFHAGLSQTLGISFGTASIGVGLLICVITLLLGEKLGLGTVLNMVLIGLSIDFILYLNVLPLAHGLVAGIPMLILGLFVIAFATYLYVGVGFGAGPRDGLMIALTRKTKLPVGVCRGTIEFLAFLSGWFLGGMAGLGTVVSAFCIGFCVQITFKLLKFEPTNVKHENLAQTWKAITGKAEATPDSSTTVSDAESNA